MSINNIQIQDENGNIYYPKTSADIVAYDDSTTIKTKIDSLNNNKIDKIIGNSGQLLTIEKDGNSKIKTSYILQKAKIVDSTTELEKEKSIEVDFADVFNNWYRFSHNTTTNQPANSTETQSWTYNSSSNTVVCPVNSATYIGFISKDKFDSYSHSVTLSSTSNDNDMIGIIIAFAKDENNIEHTISAVRCASVENHMAVKGTTYRWALVYDYLKSTAKLLATLDLGETATSGWATQGKIRLKISREGDVISACTSSFGSTTINENSKLTVNLNDHPELSLFKSACAYGYSCMSQDYSTFSDIEFIGGFDDTIYDAKNNVVYTKVNNAWVKDTSKNIIDEIGVGRFVFNENTGKLFYINGNNDVLSLSGTSVARERSEEYIKTSEINAYIDSYLQEKNLI